MRYALKSIIAGWVLAGACGFARPALAGETPAKPPGSIPDTTVEAGGLYPSGWTTNAPRDEIRPAFSFEPKGGPTSTGSLVISHDRRNGLDGWFQKQFAVTGGEFYGFHAVRKTEGVAVARRSALVRVLWQDDAGKMVPRHRPVAVTE